MDERPFFEYLTATAPFYLITAGAPFTENVGRSYDTRDEAEQSAREYAELNDSAVYVLGCVSVSSVPKPLPVKASTRALV